MITNPTIYWCFLGLQLLSHHLHGDLLLAAGGAHAVEGGGQVLHKQAGPGEPIFGSFHTFWFLDWLAW